MTVTESIGSKSPSTGFIVPDQMEVDSPGSSKNAREDSKTLRDVTSAPSVAKAFVEQELIPPTSRLSRLPATVPSSSQPTSGSTSEAAISAFQYNITNTASGQDVHFVNSSASSSSSLATRPFGQPSTPLETSVSSFPQPITQHGLNHPIRRPRTSNQVFQSSKDLAAHYGIPQQLPPAPRTSSRYQPQPPPSPKESPEIVDFRALSANYLNMLSNKSTDNTVAVSSTPAMPTAIAPAEMDAPLVPSSAEHETLHEIAVMLGESTASVAFFGVTHNTGSAFTASSPEFRDADSFDFMTSPLMPGLDQDYGFSPDETPYEDFLNTPLLPDDSMMTSPYMEDNGALFAMPDMLNDKVEETAKPQHSYSNELYTISPESPLLDSFDNSAFPTSSSTPASKTHRPSKATGIRKGITPEALLDESAPTQPRKYATPSATSKKDVPATFARKRARSTAFGDEEDQLGEDLPLNPTEKDLIEAKRRQNTVAARRSRKRKLEQFQNMEKSRDEERRLKEMWQDRANMLLEVIRGMGVAYPDFPPDQPQYSNA